MLLATAGCSAEPPLDGRSGSLALNLQLTADVELGAVAYAITGNGIAAIAGTIDTSGQNGRLFLEVRRIPVGDGYLIELTATSVDGETECRASANFDVGEGLVTDVIMVFKCLRETAVGGLRVNGAVNLCPVLVQVVGAPLSPSEPADFHFSAEGFDQEGDDTAYSWTSTSGSFDSADAFETRYTCAGTGPQSVTIAVSDDGFDFCQDNEMVVVNCVVPGLCFDAGTRCEDGNDCTQNLCDPVGGSCSYPLEADGTACMFDDSAGSCVGGVCEVAMLCADAATRCDDGNPCTDDTCDPSTGNCSNDPTNEGGACDFGGLPGMCVAGVCEEAMLCADAATRCDDGSQCTTDFCDPLTGICSNPQVTDGLPCDFMGLPGLCASGVCEDAMLCADAAARCEDGNDCTTDTCDNLTGNCSNTAITDGTSCDFGGAFGACTAGVCVSGEGGGGSGGTGGAGTGGSDGGGGSGGGGMGGMPGGGGMGGMPAECGNGILEGEEECDGDDFGDSTPISGYKCKPDCTREKCGDGTRQKPPEDCDPPAPPSCKGPDCCNAACRLGNILFGDPHFVTFDDLSYDLQTVGEQVLTRSLLGGFEVQVRTAPANGGGSRVASINTAVAARVMEDVVAVYLGESQVFVNHEPLQASGLFELPSGGTVSIVGAETQIDWPTGETVLIIDNASFFFNVKIGLTASLQGALVGLLGDDDGSPDNDIRSRGATEALASPVSNYDLYTWADSWRVTQEESLFDYGEGETTETYTDLDFPYGTANTQNLSPDVRATAEDACNAAGVVNPTILEACILDQAVTGGDPAFLEGLSDISEPADSIVIEDADLRFPDTAAYVDIPVTLASLGITDQFTVSIHFFAEPGGRVNQILFEDGTRETSNGVYLGIALDPDRVIAHLNANGVRYFNNFISSPGLQDVWTTLSMTYDGAAMRVYREGTQIYELAVTGQVDAGDRNLQVGYRSGQPPFEGLVGAVQIWNVALTPEEIAETADRDLLGTEPGLIGYWPFHEGGGTTVHDLTANANHGVLVGDVSWE